MPRKKAFQPQQALNAMTRVFWDKGYQATSISDLEKATGLNKRSLYNTFGDKEKIFDEVLQNYIKDVAPMRDVLRRRPHGLRNIKGFFAQIKDPDSRGCLLTKTINQSALIAPHTLETVRRNLLELEELFFENLLPSVRSRTKARRLTAFLSSSLQGITTMSSLDPDPGRLKGAVKSVVSLLAKEAS